MPMSSLTYIISFRERFKTLFGFLDNSLSDLMLLSTVTPSRERMNKINKVRSALAEVDCEINMLLKSLQDFEEDSDSCEKVCNK